MPQTPIDRYNGLIRSGDIQDDPAQKRVMTALNELHETLLSQNSRKPSLWSRLRGKAPAAPGGLYLFGDVGRGKTMMMDLFYQSVPADYPKKRIHFHEFMAGVHDALHETRNTQNRDNDSALLTYARDLRRNIQLLCFDEFHVTDVADAMILSRLFTALFENGMTIVLTTNWPPDRLYEGGLQRTRFLPFIDLIKDRMTVLHIDEGTDYRERLLAENGRYFYPLGAGAQKQADSLFQKLTSHDTPYQDRIEVKSRVIKVETAAEGVARFSFAQLCERPHGAADYRAITERYHTVFLEGVPKLTYDRRNETRRLMTLIDTLYDKGTDLVITADAAPENLYHGHDYAFEFQRTVSRLLEMQDKGAQTS